jgi:hypothetical protein
MCLLLGDAPGRAARGGRGGKCGRVGVLACKPPNGLRQSRRPVKNSFQRPVSTQRTRYVGIVPWLSAGRQAVVAEVGMPTSFRCFVLSRALTALFEIRAPGGESVVKNSYSRHLSPGISSYCPFLCSLCPRGHTHLPSATWQGRARLSLYPGADPTHSPSCAAAHTEARLRSCAGHGWGA